MATIRIKRRASGGGAGAPTTLKTAELAWNENGTTLYIGFGDDGSGNATSIVAIAGDGTFATKSYVATQMAGAGAGDMMKATYDPNNDGKFANAQLDNMANNTVKGRVSAGSGVPEDLTAAQLKTLLALVKGDVGLGNVDNVSTATVLASPALTGVPTAPTAATSTNTTQLATTAFVKAVFDQLIGGASSAYDTFKELQDLMVADDTETSGIITTLAGKAPLASPAFTGNPTAPTPTSGDNDTSLATTAFVQDAIATATINGGTF